MTDKQMYKCKDVQKTGASKWSYLTFLLKIQNGGENGILIGMPNDTKFIGLQSMQISNCEEKEN